MVDFASWTYVFYPTSFNYIVAILFTILLVMLLALTSFILSYGIFGTGDLVVYTDGLTFFEHGDALYRLIYAFLFGTMSLIFFSVVSLTLALLLKESFKTWIVSALFLIVSTLLLKVDFGNAILNQLAFFKLNNTWQLFFNLEINWQTIITNSVLLSLYTLITLFLGLFIFQKKDIG